MQRKNVQTLLNIDNRLFLKDSSFDINRYVEPVKELNFMHTHDFVEICYVLSGSGFHQLNGVENPVGKGDLFIINYDVAHKFYSTGTENPVVTYNIMFKPGFIDHVLLNFNDFNSLTMSYLFQNIFNEDTFRKDLSLSADEQNSIESVIHSMYAEYNLQQDGYMEIIRAYVVELLIKIMRCFNRRASQDKTTKSHARIIEQIMTYLNEHHAANYSLQDLAVKSFFSKNYICRIFKESTGTTISEYIQSLRVNEACTLLKTSDMKITRIALAVGFSDYKSFNVVFKKVVGMLPRAYRSQFGDAGISM